MTTRRHLLWVIPLLVVLALLAVLAALPRFVASNAHRASIEALASSLTGRQVHVGGPLSLALLPAPELIAGDVTIGGPADEVITARSLKLDIALPALLRGRLAARSLTLQSATIALPWPLPGGASAIVPPPWLAALHAQVNDADVSVGRLRFTGVNADIFTAGNGALSLSGSGTTAGAAVTLSLGLAPPDAQGEAALTIEGGTADGRLSGHFSGVLHGSSAISGALRTSFTLPGQTVPVAGTALLAADAGRATARDIRLTQADATLTGTVALDLATPALTLDLAGDNVVAMPLWSLLAQNGIGLPGTLKLDLTDLRLAAGSLPRLQAMAAFGTSGVALDRLSLDLPGDGALSLTGKIDAAGRLQATTELTARDLPATLAAYGVAVALPPAWRPATLRASLSGDSDHLSLGNIAGSLGGSRVAGSMVVRRSQAGVAAAGAVHFDQLDLGPLLAALRRLRPATGFSLAGELTADQAHYRHLALQHLLLDATLDRRIVVRRLSAALYGGAAIASFTSAPDGQLTAGRASLAVPVAAPLAALLQTPPPLPAVLLQAPLSLSVAAAGTPDDLATSAVATLGAFGVTAAPVLNLNAETAAGPLTLRHPDAIAALAPFGLNAGLAWPGAGSIALRADFVVSASEMGLPDFVLSFGDLTANGKILMTPDHKITAQIAADTLALPPLPAKFMIPWNRLSTAQGQIDLAANRVWLGGQQILGPSKASLTLAPHVLSFNLAHAGLGNGGISGTANADSTAGTPALGIKLTLNNVDAAGLALPIPFSYTVPAGSLNGQAALTASGFTPAAWAATLGGSANLTAGNGQIAGFDLAALTQSLQAPKQAGWQKAASGGISNFTSLAIAGSFDHGIFGLKTATLQGPDGSAAATGSIDIPDRALALRLTLTPNTTPPTPLAITSVGPWPAPKQILPPTP